MREARSLVIDLYFAVLSLNHELVQSPVRVMAATLMAYELQSSNYFMVLKVCVDNSGESLLFQVNNRGCQQNERITFL